jgi:hypothetical protein
VTPLVEFLADDFEEWLSISKDRPQSLDERPVDGDIAELVAQWMYDRGARLSPTHATFLHAVILIVARSAATNLRVSVSKDGQKKW